MTSHAVITAIMANVAVAHRLLGDKQREIEALRDLLAAIETETGRESVRKQKQLLRLAVAWEATGGQAEAIECFDELIRTKATLFNRSRKEPEGP